MVVPGLPGDVKPAKAWHVMYDPDKRVKTIIFKDIRNTPEIIAEIERVIRAEELECIAMGHSRCVFLLTKESPS